MRKSSCLVGLHVETQEGGPFRPSLARDLRSGVLSLCSEAESLVHFTSYVTWGLSEASSPPVHGMETSNLIGLLQLEIGV